MRSRRRRLLLIAPLAILGMLLFIALACSNGDVTRPGHRSIVLRLAHQDAYVKELEGSRTVSQGRCAYLAAPLDLCRSRTLFRPV
jgi:hypothetical protein